MPRRVLIVDDEPLIVKSLASIIGWERLDCKVVKTAENGKQALEMVKSEKIELVLTDIQMPEMDGITFLKELRSGPVHPKVILLSGYDEFEYARKGLQYNAFDYILKPIDYDQLEECIERAVMELKVNEKNKYEQLKHIIYNQLTLTRVEDNFPESRVCLVVMVQIETNLIKKTEAFCQWAEQQSYRYHQCEFFLYKFNHKDLTIVLTETNGGIEAVQQRAALFGKEILAFFENSCVIALGPAVTDLADLYDGFVSAQELLKMGSVLDREIISEDVIKDEFKGKNSTADLIEKAKSYMEDRFSEDIGIEQVAEKIGLSVSYFSVIFKQQTGVTFLEYLTDIRIHHACLLLKRSNMKTYDIAQKVGYLDQRYFSQVFKKKLKMTPSEYRKKCID